MKNEPLIRNISTTTGDKGTTQNYSSETLKKTDLLFEALGAMDELSSHLGLCYHYTQELDLMQIQRILQTINSLLATNPKSDFFRYEKLTKVKEEDIAWLESLGETMLQKKPLEPRFVLPGSESTLPGAYVDVARAVCRRCERQVIRFRDQAEREDLQKPLIFLNRCSDYLFLLARSFLE